MKKAIKKNPDCKICGDTGSVYKAYVDKDVSLNNAKTLVPCPKCRPTK